jgi:hypothetical protein
MEAAFAARFPQSGSCRVRIESHPKSHVEKRDVEQQVGQQLAADLSRSQTANFVSSGMGDRPRRPTSVAQNVQPND